MFWQQADVMRYAITKILSEDYQYVNMNFVLSTRSLNLHIKVGCFIKIVRS